MAPSANPYLQLLAELGVEIAEEVWNEVHDIREPTPPPVKPDRPHHVDPDDGIPVFTSAQLEWCEPEMYGFHDYHVQVGDEHPVALDWKSEVYYRGNYQPIHRYSRVYRIRWVFFHLIGASGKVEEDVLARLRAELAREDKDVIWTRTAYEWVRTRLRRWKRPDLYLSISDMVARLGGPRWRVPHGVCSQVLHDAVRLHRLFDALHRAGKLKRQRFPNLTYVLLFLLDRHGIIPPYRIPWARSYLRRRLLRHFLGYLDGCLKTGSLSSEPPTPTNASASVPERGSTAVAPETPPPQSLPLDTEEAAAGPALPLSRDAPAPAIASSDPAANGPAVRRQHVPHHPPDLL